jgi:SPP1 gp7 family putative phage head morphogenesis protein
MATYHRSADATVQTITKSYDKANKDIQSEIEKIFSTYGTNGRMDPITAKKVLNQRIPNPFLSLAKMVLPKVQNEKVKRWILSRVNAPAYRARITRLEALKESVFLQSKLIADAEITASTAGYIKTINEAYYRTMFDLQKGIGLGFDFASMPTRTIETILKNPWSGQHFSNRVWDNTNVLAGRMNEVITAGFMSGADIRKMVAELEDLSMMGKHAANRLVRTETTYMANAAEMESYEEAEIEEYQFIATLDNRTSPQCQENDLKVFKVKDAMPGVNMPPLHPYCRSTTVAYFGPETRNNIQRRARNPITGKNELISADMNYKDWHKKYVKAA